MPATYNHSTRLYRVSCNQCDTAVETADPYTRDAIDRDGRLVRETIEWRTASDRFHSRCRSCERARARARRAAGTPRRASATLGSALGLTRRFGVELEFYASVSRDAIERAFVNAGLRTGRGTDAWTIKGDGSLHAPVRRGMQGVEVTSPALSGEDGLAQVATATRILRDLGCEVNRSCGTHVHHDAADLTVEQIKTVARGWAANQTLIDWFVAPSRRQNTGYCRPLTDGDLRTIDAAATLEAMRRTYIDRYRTMNVDAYGKFGTLEIRQHQGTLSYEKIATWVRFGQAVIDTAKATGSIPAAGTVRGLLLGLGDRLDETARTFLFGRAAEFGAPLAAAA